MREKRFSLIGLRNGEQKLKVLFKAFVKEDNIYWMEIEFLSNEILSIDFSQNSLEISLEKTVFSLTKI